MFGWLKRKASDSASGAKNFSKSLVGWNQAKSGGGFIIEMVKRLNPRYITDNARKETFNQAQQRLNVNDENLREVYKQLALSFYVSMFFTVACFGVLLFMLFNSKGIMSSFGVLGILFLCLANAFRFSFRSFQIKHKKLCPVQDWWNRSSEWVPSINKPPF